MTVTGHIPIGMNAYEGVDDGMDMINHLHYVTDLLLPKDFDQKKATRQERLKRWLPPTLTPKPASKAVAFFKEHQTVIDPTIALFELQFRPAERAGDRDRARHRAGCS